MYFANKKTTCMWLLLHMKTIKKMFSYRSRDFHGITVETRPPHQVYYTIH